MIWKSWIRTPVGLTLGWVIILLSRTWTKNLIKSHDEKPGTTRLHTVGQSNMRVRWGSCLILAPQKNKYWLWYLDNSWSPLGEHWSTYISAHWCVHTLTFLWLFSFSFPMTCVILVASRMKHTFVVCGTLSGGRLLVSDKILVILQQVEWGIHLCHIPNTYESSKLQLILLLGSIKLRDTRWLDLKGIKSWAIYSLTFHLQLFDLKQYIGTKSHNVSPNTSKYI